MSEFNKVKYNQEYNKKNYKEIKLYMPAERKVILQAYCKEKGFESVNAYINDLIIRDIGIKKEINTSVSIQGNVNNMTTNGDINISNSN